MTLRDVLAQYPRAHLVVPTLWADLLACADELEAALPDLLYAAGEHASVKALLSDANIEGMTVYQQVETLVAAWTAGGWQPVETADKDADVLLLYLDGSGVQPGYWHSESKRWVACETQGLTGGGWHSEPTHWTSLPSAPRAQGESS